MKLRLGTPAHVTGTAHFSGRAAPSAPQPKTTTAATHKIIKFFIAIPHG
jgi:hypothetical protein